MLFDTKQVLQTIEQVQSLRDAHPENFILARLLLKSLTALRFHECHQLELNQNQIKGITVLLVRLHDI